jgi:hypothetical protein
MWCTTSLVLTPLTINAVVPTLFLYLVLAKKTFQKENFERPLLAQSRRSYDTF